MRLLKSYIVKYWFNQSQNMKTKIKLGIYKSWVPARSPKHWYPRQPEPEIMLKAEIARARKVKKIQAFSLPEAEKIQLTHH